MKIRMSIHDKAIRLLEGGIVEIDSDWFYLKLLPSYYDDSDCNECELGSICQDAHKEVCAECSKIGDRKCCLQLASTKKIVK